MPRVKRGLSGLSLVVGVNKPAGMSSHDVVNRCRSIFGERRVGHTGTLDPMATGVLPICVGPATRLGSYLTGHDKRYRVSIAFGAGTDTDRRRRGQVVRTGEVPDRVLDPEFAAASPAGLASVQMPPAYSAIKVNGKKSYEAARAGNIIDLAPRDIEVYDARLLGVREGDGEEPTSDVVRGVEGHLHPRARPRRGRGAELPGARGRARAHRAGAARARRVRARDAGRAWATAPRSTRCACWACGSPTPRTSWRRRWRTARSCPLPSWGCSNGEGRRRQPMCACTAGVRESCEPPRDGELVAVLTDNKLVALYAFDEGRARFETRCVFQTGCLVAEI